MSESVAKKTEKALWTRLQVTWEFPGRLCGSVPKDKELIKNWLEARKPDAVPPNARTIEEVQAEVAGTLANEESDESIEQRTWLTFQRVDDALVMRGATIRSHFKDCARIVGRMFVGKVQGESGLGWKITNGLYCEEYWVPILRPDGQPALQIDGSMDKTVHAQTRQGPISALKRIDFLTNVRMVFTLKLLCGLKVSDVETIMAYGSVHGYAGERSDGEGRYTYSIEKLD